MFDKHDYISYLLSTQITCTGLVNDKAWLDHDVVAVNDFLLLERFMPFQLLNTFRLYIEDDTQSAIIVDDSVQDKQYSRFIKLVKCQYSGTEHNSVRGIGLVNLVNPAKNDGCIWPIDCHPDTESKTKNEHFQEMFAQLITQNNI